MSLTSPINSTKLYVAHVHVSKKAHNCTFCIRGDICDLSWYIQMPRMVNNNRFKQRSMMYSACNVWDGKGRMGLDILTLTVGAKGKGKIEGSSLSIVLALVVIIICSCSG